MCECFGDHVCGYHRREQCEHPRDQRQRFWQSDTAVCRACDRIINWND